MKFPPRGRGFGDSGIGSRESAAPDECAADQVQAGVLVTRYRKTVNAKRLP